MSIHKVVGVLGGMGPYATLLFYENILNLTDADKDWDHVHLVIDNNTKIPSRTRALLFGEKSPYDCMLESCEKLENYPVDIIVIPCNSAQNWIPDLQKKIKTPIMSIVNVTAEALFNKFNCTNVAVLGGYVTYEKELYKEAIERFGAKHIKISSDLQKRTMKIIEKVKLFEQDNNFKLQKDFIDLIKDIATKEDIDAIILGCTEFSFFKEIKLAVPFVDSSTEYARFVADFANSKRAVYMNMNRVKSFWDSRSSELINSKLGTLQSTMLTQNEEEALEKDKVEKEEVLSVIKPYLNKNKIMLEMGCGTGRWTREFAKYIKYVDAIDYNEEFIKKAKDINKKQDIKNIHYHCSNFNAISSNNNYDYFTSIALLHYLGDSQFEKLVKIVKKSLKKNGIAIFRESFGYQKRFELHGYYSDVLHTTYDAIYRTSEELISKIGNNFKLIEEKITLIPDAKKPETCQKLIILQKIN